MANGHAQSSDNAHLIFKSVPPLLKLGKHRWLHATLNEVLLTLYAVLEAFNNIRGA
jgi:hypothetical protein